MYCPALVLLAEAPVRFACACVRGRTRAREDESNEAGVDLGASGGREGELGSYGVRMSGG